MQAEQFFILKFHNLSGMYLKIQISKGITATDVGEVIVFIRVNSLQFLIQAFLICQSYRKTKVEAFYGP